MARSDGLQAKIAESLFTALISLQRTKLFAECQGISGLVWELDSIIAKVEYAEKLNAAFFASLTTRKEVTTNG